MFYGLIQSNNSACSSYLITSDQTKQKQSFNVWTEKQENKFSNFERKHVDCWSQKYQK